MFHLVNIHGDALGLELGLDLLPDHAPQVYELVRLRLFRVLINKSPDTEVIHGKVHARWKFAYARGTAVP